MSECQCADRFAKRRIVMCEDGCTKLKGSLRNELVGKREDLQCIEVLVPLCDLSLGRNICGLRYCLRVGYGDSDVEISLEERVLLDACAWDINDLMY